MTGPRVETKPLGGVLSGDEWEQSQYVRGTHPTDPTKMGPPTRILTGDEWEQSQSSPAKALKIRSLPELPPGARGRMGAIADNLAEMRPARDATQTTLTAGAQKGTKIGGVGGAVLRQVVDPILENPFTTLATTAALASPVGPAVGAAMAGQMVYHIAQYGWQRAAELDLSPEDRARAEADPERISGESAAVQAAMLGLAPFIHIGVKAYRGLDVSPGMMEAGVEGVKATRLGPEFERVAAVEQAKADYHVRRVAEDVADLKETPLSSILTDETNRVGDPARRPQKQALASSVKDYEARRLVEDQADLSAARAADAEKVTTAIALAPRRRPAGSPAPYFESPQGAETLGMAAARHGLPDDANPYHPATSLSKDWENGHHAATESFPEGFAMGGIEGRLPAAGEVPAVARGADPATIPEGASASVSALANALKPSRFRGHSTDALAAEALDAQAALEQAQAAVEHARTGPLTGELALAEMENRGVSYSDSSEGTSVVADRQLAAAKSKLAQIEREFALRGVSGDDLAGVMQAAQEARFEREGMGGEAVVNDFSQFDAPRGGADYRGTPGGQQARLLDEMVTRADKQVATMQARAALAPVEGTGPVRQRGLSAGVQRKAVVNKLATTIGDVPEYRAINMADQSERAVALLESDPALARKVALGEAPAPEGLLPESVFVAVENEAIMQGDVATIRDLATGKLTSEATTMGQRIRALGERDPESPVAAIKEVITVRMGGAKNVPRATEETIALIRAQLKRVEVTQQSWAKFLETLKC